MNSILKYGGLALLIASMLFTTGCGGGSRVELAATTMEQVEVSIDKSKKKKGNHYISFNITNNTANEILLPGPKMKAGQSKVADFGANFAAVNIFKYHTAQDGAELLVGNTPNVVESTWLPGFVQSAVNTGEAARRLQDGADGGHTIAAGKTKKITAMFKGDANIDGPYAIEIPYFFDQAGDKMGGVLLLNGLTKADFDELNKTTKVKMLKTVFEMEAKNTSIGTKTEAQ